MAIMNASSGKYLKVIRDLAVFTPRSVSVSYYDFKSRSDRDEYFVRKDAVSQFLAKGNKFLDREYATLNSDIESYVNGMGLDGIKKESELPSDLRSRLSDLKAFSASLRVIDLNWQSGVNTKELKTLSQLKDLGFVNDWVKPLNPWSICSVDTGAYTNQNFTYECLYRELKKVYKGFIDC